MLYLILDFQGHDREIVMSQNMFATFAAGCFWGVEHKFRQLPGVINTQVGYTGGHVKDPIYSQVCAGDTGHAEAVQIEFDPEKISYAQLLETFWKCHNPTQYHSQGPDIGSQYRSVIFYHSAAQKHAAETTKIVVEKSGQYGNYPIVTEIVAAETFYPAEEYHQHYVEKHGGGQCAL